jgi:hypothetical protein
MSLFVAKPEAIAGDLPTRLPITRMRSRTSQFDVQFADGFAKHCEHVDVDPVG